METETHVDDLVGRWEEMRDQGTPLTIEELCAGSPELVAEVRRRIEALQAMDSALDTEEREPRSAAGDRDRPGAGPYRGLPDVLRATAVYRPRCHHDHGGQGVVFTAHQEELDRTVALKRIRPDKLHDVARRRFLREAALTARLQHPGIVPIYGLGQDDGGPFYTMPLIEGQTLQAAIEAFHGDDSLHRDPGRRSLRFRGLLQHFVTACNTVAYTHDQGVVHRDLKPSNLMLGRYGETLVMDWGLAKRFGADDAASVAEADVLSPSPSSEDLTVTGAIMGTPQYMSPEQAKGEPASPAGDIFSLGMVLYAILTGKSALEQSSLGGRDRLTAVRAAAIVPPRSRDPRVPRALEAICLKALATRAEDRYVSARGLADDVMSWLADEPVTAWREPVSIRARRWARRHRTLVASTAAVLIFSVAGLAGFTTVLAGKNRQLGQQRQRAEEREELAIDAVKKFRDAVTANPELKNDPKLDRLRKDLLREPMAFFRELRDQLEADRDTRPAALDRLAGANFDLANITREIGSIPDAIRSSSEAIAILERLARDHPAVTDYQHKLVNIYNNIGNLLSDAGNPTEGLKSHRQALTIMARLARDHPTSTEYQRSLARSHNNIASLLTGTGDLAEALKSHRKALAIREQLARDHPTSDEYQNELAASHFNIGLKLWQTGHPVDALESNREAVALRERLVREHPDVTQYRSDLASGYNNIGSFLRMTGDRAEAMKWHQRALEMRKSLARDDPTVTEYQSHLALSHHNIGELLIAMGDTAEGLKSHQRALAIRERLAHENPSVYSYQFDLGLTLNDIAEIEMSQGRWREARDYLGLAIDRHRAALAAMPGIIFYPGVSSD